MGNINRSFLIILLLFALCGLKTSAQNTCANAVNIAAIPYNSPAGGGLGGGAHTTCNKGNDYNSTMACGNTLMNTDDFVYSFTPTAANNCVTIQLNPSSGTLNADAAIFVFDGCPNLPTTSCVAQAVNNSGFGNNRAQLSNLQLIAGTQYYIIVAGGTACFPYRLAITAGTCAAQPVSPCLAATPIVSFPYSSGNNSTTGKTDDFNRGNACQNAGIDGPDVTYTFNATLPSCYRIKGRGTQGMNVSVFLGCPNSPGSTCVFNASCAGNLCDTLFEQFTLTQPGAYYLVVSPTTPAGNTEFSFVLERGPADDNVSCQTCFNEENCAPCKNVGFEKALFTGWNGFRGTYANPSLTPGLTNTFFNSNVSRHTIVTKGNYDFVIGRPLSVVSPLGNDYAVRLGNYLFNEDGSNATAGDAEQLTYSIVVDSNNTNFIYSYAVVFEDPNHAPGEQPYFLVSMTANGQEISCARYEVRASANAAGFQNGPPSPGNGVVTRWRDWTTVNIPLINFIGQTVTVSFVTKDCSRDGHFGYAYVDAKCGKLGILQSKTVLCGNDTIDLKAPDGFAKYQWSTGETTKDIKVTKAGNYTVTMTTITGCVVVNTLKIDKDEPPIFSFTSTCIDSTFRFTDNTPANPSSPVLGWEWTFGDGDSAFIKNPSHKYLADGTYPVTLRHITAAGCNLDTTIIVNADISLPKGPLNALDTIYLCEKMDLFLKSDSIIKSVYEWRGPNGFSSNRANPFRLGVAPTDSGWYRLKVRIKDCYDIFDSTYVFVEPLKLAEISKDTLLCFGDSAQLFAKGGVSCLWTPSDGLTNDTIFTPKAGPAQTTTYAVTLFNNLCPDTTLFVEIRVLVGAVSLNMPDTLKACIGKNVNLVANTTGFDQFLWRGPANYSSTLPQPSISNMQPNKVGYYYLNASISDNMCLTGYDSVYVAVYPNPLVRITPKPAAICFGDTITLNATGAATYLWTPNNRIQGINTASPRVFPTTNTSYIVTGTSVDGCQSKDTVLVTVKPNPAPTLGPDRFLCLGDSSTLKLSMPYDSVFWSTGSRSDSILVKSTNDYRVTVWKNACFGIDTVKVTFQNPGNFYIGPDTLLCAGTPYFISIPPGDSIVWNDGNTNFSRNITLPGNYSVIVYSGKCILKDTILVQFDVPPVINIGQDSVFCLGGSYYLDAYHSNLLTYTWSTGDTSSGILVGSSGTYTVEARTQRCIVRDTVLVTVVNPPILNIGPDARICNGDSVLFSSNVVCNSYLWNTGETSQGIYADTAGDYILVAQFGPCTVRDTANLFVEFPLAMNIGSDLRFCEDTSATLTASPGFVNYLWSTGQTTQSIVVNTSNNYRVTGFTALCSSFDDVDVLVDTIPHFVIEDDSICSTSTHIFTSPLPSSSYTWSNGETGKSIEVAQAGVYSLTIVNGTCNFTDDALLATVDPPQIYIGPDAIVCQNENNRFGQEVPNSRYFWNTGDTTAFITVKDTGEYILQVTYYELCNVYDTAKLKVILYPDPQLGPDRILCDGESLTLNPNTFGDTFNWSTTETTTSINVSHTGTYTVTVDNQGCVDSDTVNVRFQRQHYVKLPPDKAICEGEEYYIASSTNARYPKYSWSNGGKNADLIVRTSGNYILTVRDSACVASDTLHLTVNPNPYFPPKTYLVCPNDSIVINFPDSLHFTHSYNGDTLKENVFVPFTLLDLFAFDSKGCKTRSQIIVDLNLFCGDDLYVPNTFTPNGDGVNDQFRVIQYDMTLHEMLIFDRWGNRIFETTDPATGWNGDYKGVRCKTDVYNWKLVYSNLYGEKKELYGKVTLLK